MSLSNIKHSLNKVLSINTKYPCNTHDKVFIKSVRNSKFSGKLSLSIYIKRLVVLAVWFPRCFTLTVKYIISTDIYHLAVKFLADISNILSAICINSLNLGFLIIIFGSVNGCPCCTVNYNIR